MTFQHAEKVLTLGEALVVAVPPDPVTLDHAESVRLSVGGSELNFAIGVARLGMKPSWIGRLGEDPFGRMVSAVMADEGVDGRWITVDRERPTGVYFREWLTDGLRRPYYYRSGSAATALSPADWPDDALDEASWLHVSGITPALGRGPGALVALAVERARAADLPVSFDPNFRSALWSQDDARAALEPLARQCSLLLLAEEDSRMLFQTADPELVAARGHELGAETVVLKLGADGAFASAGDGFDAGFVTALLRGCDLREALKIGNFVGAHALQEPTEHPYPAAVDLPHELQQLLLGADARQPNPTTSEI
jgi:2-dehydro-3-deoxygluconokinase